MTTKRRRNPKEGGYDDRWAGEAFAAAQSPSHLQGEWATRHRKALSTPNSVESGIVSLIRGWLSYADGFREQQGSPIGTDYVAGPEWLAIGKSLEQLLNFELGRLDAGALDSGIREALMSQGFTEKEVDEA